MNWHWRLTLSQLEISKSALKILLKRLGKNTKDVGVLRTLIESEFRSAITAFDNATSKRGKWNDKV